MSPLTLILVPSLAGGACFLIRRDRARRALLVMAAVVHAALTARAWTLPLQLDTTDWLAIGPAALYFLTLTSALFLAVAVYTVGYLARERTADHTDPEENFVFTDSPEAVFTACLLFFLASMTLVATSQHVGLLWVAVEATTLVSAPLITFHRHHRSLEATWKYLLICSVGIALALLGNFFLAIAASFREGGPQMVPLTVTELVARGGSLHPVWLKAAFVLFVVGYGTKMGLVPLHTWLPDAHSEAPSPVSALLSGALLNCAFLAILRMHAIVLAAGLGGFSSGMLVGFGIVSVVAAAAFLVRQADYKRMLAYSSVEHMGLLALGAGLGGAGGFAALLHAGNHTMAKGLLFLAAGNILGFARTKSVEQATDLRRRLPVTAGLWIAGLLAITGMPPAGLFVSKLLIVQRAIGSGRPVLAGVLLFALAAAFERAACPLLAVGSFRGAVLDAVAEGARLAALTGVPRAAGEVQLLAVLARDCASLSVTSALVRGSYPALTPDCPQAQAFERALAEELGVTPQGHPWLKPLRFPPSRGIRCGDFPAWQVEGEEAHEVAVGPVHAGIIEPGHFRFQCRGEEVMHLEISLGYQHRGVLRALSTGPAKRRLHCVETLAGDTSVAHALAHCQAAEALAGIAAPARAQALRAVALELERLANHIGDLGALAGDVGFLPTLSYCGRIRGDALNLTAVLCGNRFGRGLVRFGGLAWDLDAGQADAMRARLAALRRDVTGAVSLLWPTPTVASRFEGTGALSAETAVELGLVGVAARACGLETDTRRCYPVGVYADIPVAIATWPAGDVYGRAWVRWLEIKSSLDLADRLLGSLPAGPVMAEAAASSAAWAPNRLVVSLVEGWRGEICHVIATDPTGGIARCDVIDPSLHNWLGLAVALRGGQISDFPLCNKSFNLSYCGHDL